ncbi:hypothetical protein BDZ89DRAFT_1136617 [Hymenopellis radicata]|nr:hypothetical protein BDZ89DRAFT_1136617 [Hymenopellis radicata]
MDTTVGGELLLPWDVLLEIGKHVDVDVLYRYTEANTVLRQKLRGRLFHTVCVPQQVSDSDILKFTGSHGENIQHARFSHCDLGHVLKLLALMPNVEAVTLSNGETWRPVAAAFVTPRSDPPLTSWTFKWCIVAWPQLVALWLEMARRHTFILKHLGLHFCTPVETAEVRDRELGSTWGGVFDFLERLDLSLSGQESFQQANEILSCCAVCYRSDRAHPSVHLQLVDSSCIGLTFMSATPSTEDNRQFRGPSWVTLSLQVNAVALRKRPRFRP